MSSDKPNINNKGSTMQSGSGGEKKEPTEKGPQKSKSAKKTMKCWICKAQGDHSTSDCPAHPKNKKNIAEASTSVGQTKPPSSIEQLIAENKCLYCGVEGHFIGNCPVKNWGKGPGAESESPNQAGSNHGVKMEPMETPQTSQATPSPILSQVISAGTKPTESRSEMPQILPGSVVSLAQGIESNIGEKRRGLKRNRGAMVDGVRMPSYKPAILLAEKEALRALAALEEEPIVVKRERTDSTESEEGVTYAPTSPAPLQKIPEQIVPKDPQPPSAQTPVRLGSTSVSVPTRSPQILPTNLNLSPLSPLLSMMPGPLLPLHKPPTPLPNPCADATALPKKKRKRRRGQKRNGGTRIGDGKRMPKYVPAARKAKREAELAALKEDAPEMEREKTDAKETAQSATRPLPSSMPKEAVSAHVVPKDPRQPRAPVPPRLEQGPRLSSVPKKAVQPINVPKSPQQPPAFVLPRLSSVLTNAVSAKTEPIVPQTFPAPALPRLVEGPRPFPAPTNAESAKVMSNAPQPSPAPARTRIMQIPSPSRALTKAISAKYDPKACAFAPRRLVPKPPPYPAPIKAVSPKVMPNAPQRSRANAPPLLQGPSLSPAPTKAESSKVISNVPQPSRAPAAPRILQGPPPSPAPSMTASEIVICNAPQPSRAPAPPRILQGQPPSPAPTKAASEKVTCNAPQPSRATALPLLQGPPPSPAPNEIVSAKIMPPNPEPPLNRAPLRIVLGSAPSPAPSKGDPQPSPVSAPLCKVQGLPSQLSEPLLEPPSPPQKPCTVETNVPKKKSKKRRGIKRNRGKRVGDTRLPHYKPKRLLEQKEAMADLKEEAEELDNEKTTIQKPGQTTPNKNITNTTGGKPIPTRNSAELYKLNKQKKEIVKRQKEIKDQKILYTKMLKAQLVMCAPVTQNMPVNPLMLSTPVPNVQYPGFTMQMSNTPVPRPNVPVTIVNHPNAAVQIPVQPEQNVGTVRNLAPVNIVGQAPKEPPKQQTDVNMMHHFTTINHYPAGVPRSFLNPTYQEHMNQHKIEQMGLKLQEQELIKQQWQIEKAAMKAPPMTDPSEHKNIAEDNSLDADQPQAYSPSDVYGDMRNESGSTEAHEGSESPDPHGQKRLSAFKRLGPVTAPKKPKLTINLKCNTDQAVREVVDETEAEFVEEYTPVHLRNDITTSTDETVMKYLFFWPWKKTVPVRRTASFKTSKSAMLLEQEQMEELYEKDNIFIQITVTNYPKHWTKENLFDVLLEQISFIPCFIEFTAQECKFLVVRCKPALLAIHKMGFKLRKEDLELNLNISVTLLTQNQIDFVPRLVLRRRLNMAYDAEGKLDLQEFTLKSDLSHFIYFPLRRLSHQTDLIQMQSVVEWERLTELNLSHNRLTSIDGFHLNGMTPHLKKLDLSYNHLEKVTVLLRCRNLPLNILILEGNPLCHDYTDPAEYVKVVRMLFPAIRELDGVKIHLKGDLPTFNKNFCLYGAENIVEKFLETFYPLLEAQPSDRLLIDDMYDENALMTVLYRYKYIHRQFRVSCSSSQFVADGVKDVVQGAGAVTKYIHKWPGLKHDPFTFTVDVLFHTNTTTIIKTCGILKLTSENLAEDEPVISFSRTTLLHSKDGVEYKILNEMLLWDEPTNECHDNAFQVTKIRSKKLYVDLEFDSTPDEESKEKLIAIFGHLTELDRNASKRCLEKKEWNLREALNNFIQLLKLNDLSSIISSSNPSGPILQSV